MDEELFLICHSSFMEEQLRLTLQTESWKKHGSTLKAQLVGNQWLETQLLWYLFCRVKPHKMEKRTSLTCLGCTLCLITLLDCLAQFLSTEVLSNFQLRLILKWYKKLTSFGSLGDCFLSLWFEFTKRVLFFYIGHTFVKN